MTEIPADATVDIADRIRARHPDDFAVRRALHDFVASCALPSNQQSDIPAPPTIFVYWAQGFANAPPIVRACRAQMERIAFDAEIVELTDDNLAYYSDLPGFVFDRLRHDRTHFSDVLRYDLLMRHGGMWADATCYLASSPATPTPDLLQRSDFFAYRRNSSDLYMFSNWFSIARPRSLIVTALRHCLVEYWRDHETIAHYFMTHFMFEALYNQNSEIRASWDHGVALDAYRPHELQHRLAAPYSEEEFEQTLKLAMVHKLTYKLDPLPGPGTVYSHIVMDA